MEGHNRPIRHSKKLLSLEQEEAEEKRKHLLIQRILLFRIHYSYRMAGIRSGLDRRQAKNNENILFVPTVVLLTQGIAKNWGRASMRQKKAIEQKTTDLACTVIHTGAQSEREEKTESLWAAFYSKVYCTEWLKRFWLNPLCSTAFKSCSKQMDTE